MIDKHNYNNSAIYKVERAENTSGKAESGK